VDQLSGTFYISDNAVKYEADTTITSFKMIDNNGITEEFDLSMDDMIISYDSYGYHHFFSSLNWYKKPAYGEAFIINYKSVLNNYSFNYTIRATGVYTLMEIEWNNIDNNIFSYYFDERKVTSTLKPTVTFLDTMEVRNVVYHNIIEIDYSKIDYLINNNTPVKTYIAGKDGLIKFERKDNVVFERIQN
jgi:hypothetical protein